jgi:hypothetical protein
LGSNGLQKKRLASGGMREGIASWGATLRIESESLTPRWLAIDEFPTSVLRFDQESLGKYEKGILFPPMRQRAEDGSNLQVIYLKNLKIMIRVDKRVRQSLFDPFLISDPASFVMAEFPVKMMKRERSFIPAITRKMKGRQGPIDGNV